MSKDWKGQELTWNHFVISYVNGKRGKYSDADNSKLLFSLFSDSDSAKKWGFLLHDSWELTPEKTPLVYLTNLDPGSPTHWYMVRSECCVILGMTVEWPYVGSNPVCSIPSWVAMVSSLTSPCKIEFILVLPLYNKGKDLRQSYPHYNVIIAAWSKTLVTCLLKHITLNS